MKKYREKEADYPSLEQEILQFWQTNNIFDQSISSRQGQPQFTFYEGPPSANGKPGIHHVMARTIKDIFCRYKTLQGFQVQRKAGWDTHGLPVELQVEKELGITKDDIGTKVSVDEYNQRCRETVMKYTDEWRALTEQMGYWVDMDNPYVTYHNTYIESVWHLLQKLHQKGLLYKGYTVQPYSPKAGTGLSSHELNQPGCYRDVTDTSITAQFAVRRNEASAFLFDSPDEEVFVLAWTTTPWTLPSNCALAIGEKIAYVKVKTFNPYTHAPVSVVLAKDRVGAYFNAKAAELALTDYQPSQKLIPYQVGEAFEGKALVGIRYTQLMPYISNENLEKNAFRVIPGDFVTTEDGTGVVHTASVFGADDFRVAQQNNVPAVMIKDEQGNDVPLVDKQGRFVAPLVAGMNADLRQIAQKHGKAPHEYDLPKYMKAEYEEGEAPEYSSDVLISILLKEQNKAFKVEKYVHSYPHCWRTDKPILYYPLDSWFVRTTAMKDKLVALNKTINWKPQSTGEGRFGNWLENLVDWNLSRQRYWGIPLPIWRTTDGTEEKAIGSVEELNRELRRAVVEYKVYDLPEVKASKQVNPDIVKQLLQAWETHQDFSKGLTDLHRPYIDSVVLVSESGKPMFRELDLIDVWFDSGAMPYAQWHYPFENQERFQQAYPADFIAEGVDQTRGWFFTLHAIAGMLFDSVAFKNVVSNGLVLDAKGQKMSKRLGNAVDPFFVLNKYGADATRWYMVSNANPWDNLRFSWTTAEERAKGIEERSEKIEEVQRRFFGTLRNTYAFFALYANLDNFSYQEAPVPLAKRPESDRWIISKLNSLAAAVAEAYEDYEPTKAARLIQDFTIDDLSNWYVRLNRKRFWKGEYNEDKIAAYQTLYDCLMTVAKLASPVMPFFSERLYQNLNEVSQREPEASIHLTRFPQADNAAIDTALEQKMTLAQRISSLTHALRKKDNLRVRLPLSRILIPTLDAQTRQYVEAVADLIMSEVNVKQVECISDDSDILVKSVKPNFRTLGQKFKAQVKEVSAVIQQFSTDDIRALEQAGQLEKEGFVLTLDDVIISSEDVQGLSVLSENGLTVALDTTLTDALQQEGIARDLVNRIQNIRKDMQLEVQDKIQIILQKGEAFNDAAFENFKEYICEETQALSLVLQPQVSQGRTIEMEGFVLEALIQKA
ncbi:isoleucine--tRNA ligase [Eisenibacter elegans]|uniref:isoleucine--tRNA ligase n=1 Tax=Eisenibacter elegans TaxID=997 RepID=UPI0004225DED|nr:isoleucine--tRNA ligase [Eisenibacter elegans]